MALVPNWIDLANQMLADEAGGPRCECVVKDGSTLWGVFSNYATSTKRRLHKSLDAGVTWVDTGLDVGNMDLDMATPPDNSTLIRTLVIIGTTMHFFGASESNTNMWWSRFDLTAPTSPWTDWELLPFTFHGSALISDGTIFAGGRSNGDVIFAYQNSDAGVPVVTIKKYASATWSTVGTIGSATQIATLQSGVMDPASDAAHIIVYETAVAGSQIPDLMHYSLSSGDTLSSGHTIQTAVDGSTTWGSVCNGPPVISGTTIAVAYGDQVQDLAYNSSTYGTLKVAFGDLSGNPLNPTWSLTTVNSTPDFTLDWPSNTLMQAAVGYNGVVPEVYYTTPYPAAFSPYPNWTLWRSTYVSGAWTTPTEWYDPANDTNLDAYRAGHNDLDTLANFHLVHGFTNGIGILVDVEDWYAGYSGPRLSINYVSAGGPMVSRGNYVSA